MGDYHKLEVWKLACQLSDRVAKVVESLPARIRIEKGDQLSRAADAIHENIAEGCGFNSDPQLAKYLRQALGSADETQDELETLNRRGFLAPENQDLLPAVKLLCKRLSKFIDVVESSTSQNRKRSART